MNKTLDISFIICTRNRRARLPAVLNAFAGLKTNHAWELLFVDNASTDDTAAFLQAANGHGARLRYLRVDRIGLGAARDAGWRQATGRIIAFTDDDCYIAQDYADQLVAAYDAHPDAGCIGGRVLLHDPTDARMTIHEQTVPTIIPPYRFIEAGTLQGANISFRRSVLEAIGGFDPDFGAGTSFPCEDIDAAAATLWSGFPARFEPALVIWHHHGRKDADIKFLRHGYDRGRGAYYAKYLLRPDTRTAYLRGWRAVMLRQQGIEGMGMLTRELASGFFYLRHRKAHAFLLAAAPVAAALYLWMAGLLGWRGIRRAMRRLATQ